MQSELIERKNNRFDRPRKTRLLFRLWPEILLTKTIETVDYIRSKCLWLKVESDSALDVHTLNRSKTAIHFMIGADCVLSRLASMATRLSRAHPLSLAMKPHQAEQPLQRGMAGKAEHRFASITQTDRTCGFR